MRNSLWKKFLSFFMIVALLVACGIQTSDTEDGNSSSASGSGSETGFEVRPIDIAMVSLYDDDEWAKDFSKGFYDTGEKYQEVNITDTSAGYDQAQMITQLNTVIRNKPDVLVIRHASQPDAVQPVIENAIAEGIKVIIASVRLPETEGLIQVNQDDQLMAEFSLEELAKEIDYKGDIAVMWVGGYANMEERRKGLEAILEKYPDINVVAEFGSDGNTVVSDTVSRTQALLRQYPEPGQLSAIWASWDAYAIGAVQAQEILNRDIPIFGIDFSEHNRELMAKEGSTWKATAATNTVEYGATVMRAAILAAYGEELPSEILIPPVLITQNNLPATGDDIHQYMLSLNPSAAEIATSPLLDELLK